MNRRKFLATIGGVAGIAVVAGGSSVWYVSDQAEDNQSKEFVENAPEEVEASEPLAQAFYSHITGYYPEARVLIRSDGDITMEYPTDAGSGEEVTTEFHQIAVEYATVVGDEYDPKTLTMVTSEVKALAVEPAVKAYTTGEIDKKGFLETIEVTGVERSGN